MECCLVQVENYRKFAEKCIKPKGLSLKRLITDYAELPKQNGAEKYESSEVDQGEGTDSQEVSESEDEDTETVSSIINKVRMRASDVVLFSHP